MERRKFSEKTIFNALQEAKTSRVVTVCVRLGITYTTFYRWKRKYKGMDEEEIRRLRARQKENKPIDLVPGSLELLVLQTLRNNEEMLRASEIKKGIEKRSDDRFIPERSSIFDALKRLEKDEHVTVEKIKTTTGVERNRYGLTPTGRSYLAKRLDYWQQAIKKMNLFLYGKWGSDHDQEPTQSHIPDPIKCRPTQGRGWFPDESDDWQDD